VQGVKLERVSCLRLGLILEVLEASSSAGRGAVKGLGFIVRLAANDQRPDPNRPEDVLKGVARRKLAGV